MFPWNVEESRDHEERTIVLSEKIALKFSYGLTDFRSLPWTLLLPSLLTFILCSLEVTSMNRSWIKYTISFRRYCYFPLIKGNYEDLLPISIMKLSIKTLPVRHSIFDTVKREIFSISLNTYIQTYVTVWYLSINISFVHLCLYSISKTILYPHSFYSLHFYIFIVQISLSHTVRTLILGINPMIYKRLSKLNSYHTWTLRTTINGVPHE